MPQRLFVDAGAQSTVSGAITNSQTTVTLASASGFGAIAASQQLSVVILDSGNPAYVAANPLATPFEYQPVTGISGNVLTFGGGTRAAYAGTTPKAYFAGATVAAVQLAEDLQNSFPIKIDDITVAAGTSVDRQNIPATGSALEIIWEGAAVSTLAGLTLQFNNDSGAGHYTWQQMQTGSNLTNTMTNPNSTGDTSMQVGFVRTVSGSGRLWIPNYANTARRKRVEGTNSGVDAGLLDTRTISGDWNLSGNPAINRVTLTAGQTINARFIFMLWP